MRRFVLFLAAAAALSWACSDDDPAAEESPTPVPDGGFVETPDADGVDAGVTIHRVLLAQGRYASGSAKSELAAVNLADGGIDGRLAFDGVSANITVDGAEPWLVDQGTADVYRLDPAAPWKVLGKWNVTGDDAIAGADPAANPMGVVTPAANKAYVIRYNRNQIAVIDPSDTSSPAPKKYIDLSGLKQTGDTQQMEIGAATYIASKRRVYVVLGNADLTRYNMALGGIECPTAALKSSIIAIDPDTDSVVSLGGTAPGGGIALDGYIPITPSPLVYDSVGDRLLVASGGCITAGGDVRGREVESVSLADGATKVLLDLTGPDFPTWIAFLDANSAAVAFFGGGRLWNPADGAAAGISLTGIGAITADGRGAYLGTRTGTLEEGGASDEVISIQRDGGVSVVTTNPFTSRSEYISGIAAWSSR